MTFRPLHDLESFADHIKSMLGHIQIPPFSENYENLQILKHNVKIIDQERNPKVKNLQNDIAAISMDMDENYKERYVQFLRLSQSLEDFTTKN